VEEVEEAEEEGDSEKEHAKQPHLLNLGFGVRVQDEGFMMKGSG